jgi:arylsulfatase A
MGTMVLSLLSTGEAPPLGTSRQPNILLIVADDLGFSDIGCHGARGYQTPNIDRLAREGRRFTNYHVAHSICSASRAALLTGCYANRIGIQGALFPRDRHGLSSGETTIADLLKRTGYATGMAGKWHLGDNPKFLPLRHGFDEFLGVPYSHDMWPGPAGPKNPYFPPLPLIDGDAIINPNVTEDDQRRLTTKFTEHAVSFIERHKDGPFFYYLAHTMPHVPLYSSEKFAGKSERGAYGDAMMELDWSVGEVLKALESNGVAENTWVIFTSDNGPWLAFGDHGGAARPLREGKGTVWEGGIRVPCIMRWPAKVPERSLRHSMFMSIDLLPTIAAVVGAHAPENPIDGRDVSPILFERRLVKSPHDGYLLYNDGNQLQAVMSGDGRWKLVLPHMYKTLGGGNGGSGGNGGPYIHRQVGMPELYHLTRDISETNDVSKRYPEIMEKLLKVVDRGRDELGDSLKERIGCGARPAGTID